MIFLSCLAEREPELDVDSPEGHGDPTAQLSPLFPAFLGLDQAEQIYSTPMI